MRRRAVALLEAIDVIVAALFLVTGIALTAFLGLGGATAIEVGLVLVLVVSGTAYWVVTSSALDWLREPRAEARKPPGPGPGG